MAILAFSGESVVSRRQFLRGGLLAGSLAMGLGIANFSSAAPAKKLPAWRVVQATVQSTLATRHGYQSGDLLSRSDIEGVLNQLKAQGWEVANGADLVKNALEDGHFLVRELRTSAGVKFSRAVMHDKNVYDRLDRLSQFSGGHNLIKTIITLPDGTKLMSDKPSPQFGDLTALLPKQANGMTPKDKNFDKPTGKIYNESELLIALAESYEKAKRQKS